MKHVILNNFTFNLDGFKASYNLNGTTFHLRLDPCATCELFKSAGVIEDFSTDKNGEPVILFADNNFPPGYGFEFWCMFTKTFPVSYRIAQMILEHKHQAAKTKAVVAKIENLLSPLAA